MRRRNILITIFWLLLLPAAMAEDEGKALRDHPGYFPLEELDILDPEKLTLEVNLHAPMLKLVAAATRKADPDLSQLVEGLAAIRVRIAPIDQLDREELSSSIDRAGRWLRDRGWQTIVRAEGGGEEVNIYLRQLDDEIVGLAILAFEGGSEATVINVAGPIDLEKLGGLAQKLDIPYLGEAVPKTSPPAAEEKD